EDEPHVQYRSGDDVDDGQWLSCVGLSRPSRPSRLPYTTLFRSVLADTPPPTTTTTTTTTTPPTPTPTVVPAGVTLAGAQIGGLRSEEHTSELQSRRGLVCRLRVGKKKGVTDRPPHYTSPPTAER